MNPRDKLIYVILGFALGVLFMVAFFRANYELRSVNNGAVMRLDKRTGETWIWFYSDGQQRWQRVADPN